MIAVTALLGTAVVDALTALARLLGDPRRGAFAKRVDLLVDPTRDQAWRALQAASRSAEDTLLVHFVGPAAGLAPHRSGRPGRRDPAR
ncbi:hypothetical protein Dvina_10710 [Dactylosporangium vinaceum]|uniref:Uncharacterized protein n=1 Tax=Dactylosporangium vinaceum TaxID=53362 RepID=A0ABV5MBS5_9ACTN|nr:hypothetical protein [Dactylosporangium vinaceum]UAB98510.1 hypothetical protein Dvina_10710 [Dactylosporangium vinaceum]